MCALSALCWLYYYVHIIATQAALTSSKLQLTKKDLAASQLLSVQQAVQLNQQGQQLTELHARSKQLEQRLLEAQQQVGACGILW